MELSTFAMQLALELYWKIRRHVERGGGEQEIVKIVESVDISGMPIAEVAHRPPGPPRLSPIQPWKTPGLHKERLIAHTRGANADRGELRTKTGLPHFSGDPLAFRYPMKYGNPPPGFEGLPYGLLGPEAVTILSGSNRAEAGYRGRGSAWLRVREGKVRAQAHQRRLRARERVTITRRRKIIRRILYLEGPRKNDRLQFLRSPGLILLRKQWRLSKKYDRNTIRFADEKGLEVEAQGLPSKRGEGEGQDQVIKDDGEGRVLCDDEDTDSDDSGEDDEYFEDAEDGMVGDDEGSRKDMEHSNEHGDKDDADDDDWDDGDCDTPSTFHVENSKLSGKIPQIEGNGGQIGCVEDSDDDSDGDSATGEWVANVEGLIQVEIQKETRKREKAMATLRGARERLKRDPKFHQLPSARQRWIDVDPSFCPTAPETGSWQQSNTSTNMPVAIRGGFDGLSNNAKVDKHAVREMSFVGKLPVPEPSILTVMFESHQTGEGSNPPPAPRPQHTAPSPVPGPSPAAFTQPSFRSPYVPRPPPAPPSPQAPTPQLLPLTTQSASLAPLPSTMQNAPIPASAPSLAVFSQPSFRAPYIQPPTPSQSIPWPTQSVSRIPVSSSTQYSLTPSTLSGAACSQSSLSYPYVMPSTHPQPPIPPSTHNHPHPVSVPSSSAFSHPFFTSPYAQAHPQSISWSAQLAAPASAPPPTQSHPNPLVPSSSSQLPPST